MKSESSFMRKFKQAGESKNFQEICDFAERGDKEKALAIETLTLLIDRRYDTKNKRRSDIISLFEEKLFEISN